MRVLHIITGIPLYCHPGKCKQHHRHPGMREALIRDLRANLIKLNRLFIRSRHKAGTTDGARGQDDVSSEYSNATSSTTFIPETAKRLSET